MGYLDNTTITVDAVITKQGRRLMAQGGSIDVQYFSLTDVGIDYRLWNTDHPSGSSHYGEAIENLPQTEALPFAERFMRYHLVTLDKTTPAMPVIYGINDNSFGQIYNPVSFSPQLMNHSEPSGFYLVVQNASQLSITGGTQVADFTANALQFVDTAEIGGQARLYSGFDFNIGPSTALTSAGSQTLTFISITTGAFKSVLLEWDKLPDGTPATDNPVS